MEVILGFRVQVEGSYHYSSSGNDLDSMGRQVVLILYFIRTNLRKYPTISRPNLGYKILFTTCFEKRNPNHLNNYKLVENGVGTRLWSWGCCYHVAPWENCFLIAIAENIRMLTFVCKITDWQYTICALSAVWKPINMLFIFLFLFLFFVFLDVVLVNPRGRMEPLYTLRFTIWIISTSDSYNRRPYEDLNFLGRRAESESMIDRKLLMKLFGTTEKEQIQALVLQDQQHRQRSHYVKAVSKNLQVPLNGLEISCI